MHSINEILGTIQGNYLLRFHSHSARCVGSVIPVGDMPIQAPKPGIPGVPGMHPLPNAIEFIKEVPAFLLPPVMHSSEGHPESLSGVLPRCCTYT